MQQAQVAHQEAPPPAVVAPQKAPGKETLVESAGQPLPGDVRGAMEAGFGTDFGQVRVHTGADAAERAEGHQARAYTVGNDVVFGAGEYQPHTPAGQHLLAHELAHTVQQRGAGPAAGLMAKGLLGSQPGDAVESAADRAADQVVGGGRNVAESLSPVAAPAVMRTPRGGGNDGSGSASPIITDEAQSIDNGAGGTVAPGQAGYSRRMLALTTQVSEGLTGDFAQFLIHNVAPNVAGIEPMTRTRAREIRVFREKAGDFFNTPSTTATWTRAAEWSQAHLEQMERDRASQEETFATYNAWVPRANGYYTCLQRLMAQEQMLGAGDLNNLAITMLSELDAAEQVGARAQLAHDAGNPAANLPALPSDGSLTQVSAETTQAAREMNTAYLGFQARMTRQRAEAINAEGAQDRARLEQINETKTFLRNVGRTVDVTMSVVQGAPAAISNATETVQRAGASINAARNMRQIRNGDRPTHNPTYVTTDEDGNMVVRNMQTNTDRPVGGGESSPAGSSGSISLPTSVSDLLGTIADFAYAGEVREINQRLEEIKARCSAANVAAAFIEERQVAQNLQDKVNAFAIKCRNLQARIAERRQQYLEFGVALDNFARQDAATRGAGQAPGRSQERFATLMTILSTVREAHGIGRGAAQGFQTPAQLRTWAQGLDRNRSRNPPRTDIEFMSLSEGEISSIEALYRNVTQFNGNVDAFRRIFDPVELRAVTMMANLHQGGGSGEY